MLLILYVMIVTPFELAFIVSRPLRRQVRASSWRQGRLIPNKRTGLWLANQFVNCGFLIDMYLNFTTAYFDKDAGTWRTDHLRIANHYVKSWFLLDLLTILPMEYVAGEEALLVRLLRLFRLAKLLKALQSPALIARMTKHIDLSTKIQTVIKYCAILLMLVHWSACALRLVTDFNLGMCEPSAGLDPIDSLKCPPTTLTRGSHWGDGVWAVYLEACTWALIALNGEAAGHTHAELTLGLLVMLTGIVILAFLIGDLSNIMSNLDPVKNEFTKTLDSLNDYMHESGFPRPLRLKLREYILMSEPVYRDTYNKEMLSKLSPTLIAIVARQNLGKVVNRIPFYTYTIQSVIGHKVGSEVLYLDSNMSDSYPLTHQHGRPVRILRNSAFLQYDIIPADVPNADDYDMVIQKVPHSRLYDRERNNELIDRGIRLNYQRDAFVAQVARLFDTQLFMAWDEIVHRDLSLNDTLYVIHTGKILLLGFDPKKAYGICVKQQNEFFGGDVALMAVNDKKFTTRTYSAHATQMTQVYAIDALRLYELLQHPSVSLFYSHFRMWGCWLLLQRHLLEKLAHHVSRDRKSRTDLLRLSSHTPLGIDNERDEEKPPKCVHHLIAHSRKSLLPVPDQEADISLVSGDAANILELSADIVKYGLESGNAVRSALATPHILALVKQLVVAMRSECEAARDAYGTMIDDVSHLDRESSKKTWTQEPAQDSHL